MSPILKMSTALVFTLSVLGCGQQNQSPNSEASTTRSAQSNAEASAQSSNQGRVSIDFEKYELANGLEVVLHVDKSDPVVAIDLAAHVGSGREIAGRTGFAHLFEHLLFLDSENLGYGGLDEMNTRIGGEGTNGFTTNDMTQYYQAVPADALEKVIWAEADKLGYFINTVTQEVIDNEKQVVKNEKRQRVDNQPYGHNFSIIGKTLYPADHPYSWQVIGSLADLDAATLEDVKNFYKRWYVPNNVTVTIAGDFDPAEAKQYVEKYFGEIPRGEDITNFQRRPGELSEPISLYYEDNFATVPQLTMVWPTVEEYHPDSYPLSILLEYLSTGKRAVMNQVLIDEEKLTSSVNMFNFEKQISGEAYLLVNSNANEDLDGLPAAIDKAFARFEENGISTPDLERIKAGIEVGFYGQFESALGKAIQLSEYNIFTGDPGYASKDIEAVLAVTPDDVMRVYKKYIKDKPFIATSIVPKGAAELALEGAKQAEIVEEAIVENKAKDGEKYDPTARTFEPTPSSFDRTIEPDFGKPYSLPKPVVWRNEIGNGIDLYGMENTETPLVFFSLSIDAGRARGDVNKPAIANLTADLMEKGTANKTTAELEDEIKALGSNISINAGLYSTVISGSTLSRNFEKTIALVEEMLLEPRWDAEEFETIKRARLNRLVADQGNPNAIAAREAAKLRYDDNHMFRYQAYGTIDKLQTVTLDDLKSFYQQNYAPSRSSFRIAGAVSQAKVETALNGIASRWDVTSPPPLTIAPAKAVDQSRVYFYDVPGSKQSILNIARPSLSAVDPDYSLATAMNFLLGNIYTSRLNTVLRVENGYTYGIGSRFNGLVDRGTFNVFSSVRTNVTLESLLLIRDIISDYGNGFTQEDLDTMKSALLRGQALQNETLRAKLGLLGAIATFNYPDDFQARNAARIEAMTLDEFKGLASKYLRPDAMNWLVVGDAQTQAARLESLGYGAPIILEADSQ